MKRKTGWRQGYYRLTHPEKYIGDANKIRFMSSWELSVHKFFDNTPSILHWNSEGIRVPYIKPTDGNVHYYLPDYWVEYRKKDGTIIQELIEVKPRKQTRKSRTKDPKRKLNEDITYAINLSKWTAARKYAKDRGWGFRILTEKEIYK